MKKWLHKGAVTNYPSVSGDGLLAWCLVLWSLCTSTRRRVNVLNWQADNGQRKTKWSGNIQKILSLTAVHLNNTGNEPSPPQLNDLSVVGIIAKVANLPTWFNSSISLVYIIKSSPGTKPWTRCGPFLQNIMSFLYSTEMKELFKLKVIQYFLRCRLNKISSSCPGGQGFEWNTGCTGLRWFSLVSQCRKSYCVPTSK